MRKVTHTQDIQRYPRPRLIPESEEWPSKKVFGVLHAYLTSQIHFTKVWQPVVVALWAMGTYLHRNFSCYGHLWLNSLTTHSGKTKLLQVLSAICYEPTEPQLNPTAAVLFRFPSQIGGTLLIDEVDKLDPAKKDDVIAILNHYHQKGAVLRAMGGRKGQYKLEKFPVYCPKAIAGIENLPVTLQDRCIKIDMHRKTKSETVERFMPESAGVVYLKKQVDTWSSVKGLSIFEAYQNRDGLGVPDAVESDRVRDILEPLFAITSVLPGRVRRTLAEAALELSKGRSSEESETNPIVATLRVLKSRFPKKKDVWKVRTVEVHKWLSDVPGLEDERTARATMHKIGFQSHNCKFDKHVLKAYRIPRKALDRLIQRYLPAS